MGMVGYPQHFGKWVRKKGGDYFTYGRNLINNWIFSMKAETKC
jgi:hypothetical protein